MQLRLHNPLRFVALSLVAAGAFLLPACNNASEKSGDAKPAAAQSIPLSTDSAARVDDFSFIDGCVETNAAKTDTARAFAYCKCIMAQIKLKYGSTDSATIARLQQDTAETKKILNACR